VKNRYKKGVVGVALRSPRLCGEFFVLLVAFVVSFFNSFLNFDLYFSILIFDFYIFLTLFILYNGG